MLCFLSSKLEKIRLSIVLCHILIISSSNYLVQVPVTFIGFHSTWGALSLPFLYVLSDLTVKFFGNKLAKNIVFTSMFPALILSYIISVMWYKGKFIGFDQLFVFNTVIARIAVASFLAYLTGQLLDILIFWKLRKNFRWWVAPLFSGILGNTLDSFIFFSVAFYKSSDVFLAKYWVEIAWVDFVFKIGINLIFFLPIYGIISSIIMKLFKAHKVCER